MRISIFGAGNIGLACAAVLSKEHDVVLHTSKQHDDMEKLKLEYEGKELDSGVLSVTSSAEDASSSELILCTYPAFLRRRFVAELSSLLGEGHMVGFVPGYGGIEYYCQDLIKKGVVVFGFQRVPYVSRSDWSNRFAGILSAKSKLYVAALPKIHTARVSSLVEALFGIPTTALKEFLAVTLVPSNPLLHTVGSYGIFRDYREGDTYPGQLMFYEEWNDETSEMLLEFDSELQEICDTLHPLVLSEVVSLREYYESPTAHALTRKLKSIEAFEAVKAPMRRNEDGLFVPNWDDRMFTEDFPFGVAIIRDIARMTGVNVPVVDTLLEFYRRNTGIELCTPDGLPGKDCKMGALPSNYGLCSKDEFVKFYLS